MSERARVVLIFAAVLLLAGGAGFYFFKIRGPAQDLKNAQSEIAGWEERWQAARACLLGRTPASSRTSEALAVHEMAPDPWEPRKCTPLVSKLSRGEAAAESGIPAVETAWGELDKAAQKAATAFAMHVGSSTTITKDPLPAALDALDVARMNLRKAAELPANEQGGGRLAPAEVLPLMDGKDPITHLQVDTIPSAHGIVLFGRTESRSVQLTLATAGTPKLDRIGPSSMRAVPDTTWGASPAAGGIRVGAFDAEGAMPTELSMMNATIVAAAVGSLKQGTVVAGNDSELYFARVKDSAVTIDPPVKITYAEAAFDLDGRAVAIWDTAEAKQFGRVIDPSGEGATVELPSPMSGQPCLTKDRAWIVAGGGAVSFGPSPPTLRTTLSATKLQGCSVESALFRSVIEPNTVTICGDQCRKALVPSGAPAGSALTVVGGKLVAIASHGSVLGVWREGAQQPTFFALPEDARPLLAHELTAMAMTDGKVIDILARGDKTFVVLRIPAN